jgi:aminoglycoside phosphotransferase (APT) family kinase protein
MTRRRSGTNWLWVRWLIESNLRQRPEFQKDFRLEKRIEPLGQGLFHRNYWFEAGGAPLVLRLSKIEPGWQNRKEAVISLRKEAKTLQALEAFDLLFEVPRLLCLVRDDSVEPVGLIESAVTGWPLLSVSGTPLEIIAKVAGAIHNLPKTDFPHLKMRADSQAHVIELLDAFPSSLFDDFEEARHARDWILLHASSERPSVVLHGDLLPQNLLVDNSKNGQIAVVDWESAQIGDPAYDLAIVTRGVRKPLGITDGRQWLVDLYNETAPQKIEPEAVIVHELLLHLNWLAEAAARKRNKDAGGHGPDHYAGLIQGILRRAKTGDNRGDRD